ncbi:MAG TPA: hypothetical protein VFX20_06580 [Steroidobacteraceae bacterium]|nr:hypothetical protein [Steroidobacteraceae bacterium]
MNHDKREERSFGSGIRFYPAADVGATESAEVLGFGQRGGFVLREENSHLTIKL